MRPIRITGEATIPNAVREILERFEYPDADTLPPPFELGGGGGMAHVLIVSTSEPQFVQDKADFVCPETGAASTLNAIFSTLDDGPWSIWIAGRFNIESDVGFPSAAWIRGLGFSDAGVPI